MKARAAMQKKHPVRTGRRSANRERNRAPGDFCLTIEPSASLRTFINNAPTAVAMFDQKMRYLACSPRWRSDYGLTKGNVLGTSHYKLFPEISKRWRAVHRRGLRGEVIQEAEDRFARADGTVQWLRWEVRPWQSSPGHVGGIVIFTEDITRRKVAEYELARHTELLETLSKTAPIGLGFLDSALRFVRVNDILATAAGYSAGNCIGQRISNLFPKLRPALRPLIRQALAGAVVRDQKISGFTRTSPVTTQHWRVSFFPVREGERIVGVGMVVVDVTEQNQIERSHRESEERLRAILNTVVDSVITIDRRGNIMSVNQATTRMFGYTEADLIGQNVKILMPSPYREEHDRYLANYRRTGRQRIIGNGREVEARRRDGTRFPIDLAVSKVDHLNLFTGLIRDISERNLAQDKIRRNEQALAAFFEHSPIGLVWTDIRGRISRVNPAQLAMLARSEREVVGHLIGEFDAGRELMPLIDIITEPDTMVQNQKALLRNANGNIKHVLVDVSAVRREGQIVRVDWFIRDVSRRVELEREVLAITERERQRLGQDLHDDLCQTLTGIGFRCDTLAQELSVTAMKSSAEAQNIARMIRDAAKHTRILARGLSPVSLQTDGLETALQELAARTKDLFRVDCRFRCRTPVDITDEAVGFHLYRIAQEAVSNAIKHGRPKRIDIELTRTDNEIVLGVSNDGRRFPRNARTNKGMGLRVMQYRAGVIGGTLVVQRDPKSGTAVVCTVRL